MRVAAALLLCLLITTPADAQMRLRTRSRNEATSRRSASPVVFRAAFATPGCYTSPVADTGQALTVTRASSESCLVGGVLTQCTSNQLCVEDATGALVQGTRTNLCLRSEAFTNASWTKQNVTMALNATGPDGVANSATTVTDDATVDQHRWYQAMTTGTSAISRSIYAKAGTASWISVVDVDRRGANFDLSNGVVGTLLLGATAKIEYVRDGWWRCEVTGTDSGGSNYLVINMGTTEAQANGGSYQGQSKTVLIYGAQVEAGASVSSYIPTVASTVSRPADLVSAANPLTNADTYWCVASAAQPYGGRLWASETTALWALGTLAAANSATLESNADGTLVFKVYDSGATLKQGVLAAGPGSGLLTACSNAGTLEVYRDGVAQALTGSGAGTGIITTQPATLWLGSSNASTLQLSGGMRAFAVSKRGPPALSRPTGYRVAAVGDSLTEGNHQDATIIPYPRALQTSLASPWVVDNYGYAGDTACQVRDRWRSFAKGRGYGSLLVWGGVNNLRVGTSAATTFACLQTIYDEAAAEGIRVVTINISPWGNWSEWDSTKQAQTVLLNASIAAYSTSAHYNAYSALGDTDPTKLLAAYDYGDGLHLTTAGYAVVAAGVRAVLP